MKKNASAQTRPMVVGREAETGQMGTEVSKVTIGAIGVLAALIGLWGLAAFVGGVVHAGGPIELVRSWWSAVTIP